MKLTPESVVAAQERALSTLAELNKNGCWPDPNPVFDLEDKWVVEHSIENLKPVSLDRVALPSVILVQFDQEMLTKNPDWFKGFFDNGEFQKDDQFVCVGSILQMGDSHVYAVNTRTQKGYILHTFELAIVCEDEMTILPEPDTLDDEEEDK